MASNFTFNNFLGTTNIPSIEMYQPEARSTTKIICNTPYQQPLLSYRVNVKKKIHGLQTNEQCLNLHIYSSSLQIEILSSEERTTSLGYILGKILSRHRSLLPFYIYEYCFTTHMQINSKL